MATITTRVCDTHPDRTSDVQPIAFGYNGQLFEMDACRPCRTSFERVFGDWASRATPVKPKGKRGELAEIRQWARQNGWPTLSDMGVVPADVLAAYEARNEASNGHGPAPADRSEPKPLRRSYTDAEKRRIVKESYKSSVKETAEAHDIHPTMVTRWRREFA